AVAVDGPITTTLARGASVRGDVPLLHISRREVDHALTHIRCPISDSLQDMSDPEHVGRFGDMTRISDHRRNQLLISAVVKGVDVVILKTNCASHVRVL